MTAITDHQLYEVGLKTDEITGFRTMLANPGIDVRHAIGLAPDHFKGIRLANFERGAEIAHFWLRLRNDAGQVRRRFRAKEIKEIGMCTPIDELKPDDEALAHLRLAVGNRNASFENSSEAKS